MSKTSSFHKESGNAGLIALVVLIVAGVAAFAFFAGQHKVVETSGDSSATIESASGAGSESPSAETPTASADEPSMPDIKPGNPVVAKVNGQDITRLDILNHVKSLPPQVRQLPLDRLFPMAVDQVVTSRIVMDKTKDVKLDNDPEVKKQLDAAKQEIVRSVYLQKEVEKKITEDRLKQAYDDYVKNFPNVQEVKARHILVKEESKAKELIKKLNEGGDFEALAKENSTDGTAEKGGDLGYFVESEVVPEFSKVAFSTEVGTYTKAPVKTDFGYHIIKVEDKRQRKPGEFTDVKPALEAQLRRQVLEEMVKGWREQAKVEVFDINGNKVEPSSGG